MTKPRKPRPRRPLMQHEREKIQPYLAHLIQESFRDDLTIYTNRADYAEACGAIRALTTLEIITPQDGQDWRFKLESSVQAPRVEARDMDSLPGPVAAEAKLLERAIRRISRIKPEAKKGQRGYGIGQLDMRREAIRVLWSLVGDVLAEVPHG